MIQKGRSYETGLTSTMPFCWEDLMCSSLIIIIIIIIIVITMIITTKKTNSAPKESLVTRNRIDFHIADLRRLLNVFFPLTIIILIKQKDCPPQKITAWNKIDLHYSFYIILIYYLHCKINKQWSRKTAFKKPHWPPLCFSVVVTLMYSLLIIIIIIITKCTAPERPLTRNRRDLHFAFLLSDSDALFPDGTRFKS